MTEGGLEGLEWLVLNCNTPRWIVTERELGWERKRCHDTIVCIVTGEGRAEALGSQYTDYIVTKRGLGCMPLCRDTVARPTTRPIEGLRHDRLRACDTAIKACDTAWGHDHDTAIAPTTRPYARSPERAYAHLGVLTGSAGCAHCALVQFLDSVLFLSHCLNNVHHKKKIRNFFLN